MEAEAATTEYLSLAFPKLDEDGKTLLKTLVKQFTSELQAGGPRPRWSIMKNLVQMTEQQISHAIDMYERAAAQPELASLVAPRVEVVQQQPDNLFLPMDMPTDVPTVEEDPFIDAPSASIQKSFDPFLEEEPSTKLGDMGDKDLGGLLPDAPSGGLIEGDNLGDDPFAFDGVLDYDDNFDDAFGDDMLASAGLAEANAHSGKTYTQVTQPQWMATGQPPRKKKETGEGTERSENKLSVTQQWTQVMETIKIRRPMTVKEADCIPFVEDFIEKMVVAAKKDDEDYKAGLPTLHKLKMLPYAENIMCKSTFAHIFVGSGGCRALALWLRPLPTGEFNLDDLAEEYEKNRPLPQLERKPIETFDSFLEAEEESFKRRHPLQPSFMAKREYIIQPTPTAQPQPRTKLPPDSNRSKIQGAINILARPNKAAWKPFHVSVEGRTVNV